MSLAPNHVDGPRERAVDALAAVLPPKSEARRLPGTDGRVSVGGTELVVAWAGEGGLGDVRRLLATGPRPDLVVARQLSSGAREALRSAGVGWVDETGAAEIAIGSIIVSRTGRSPEQVRRPPRWTPAVLAVSEALLCGTRGTVTAAAAATGLSTGSCTNALRVLTDLGLLETNAERGRGSARRVTDRRGLLDAYAAAAVALRPTLSLQIGVAWRDPVAGLAQVGDGWGQKAISWAATGGAAASVLAPHLGSVTVVDAYVGTTSIVGLEAIAAAVGLKPIDGGRLTLRPFPTAAIDRLSETIDGLRIAPWPRVFVDLLDAGVWGEEAAEHLWEVVDARR